MGNKNTIEIEGQSTQDLDDALQNALKSIKDKPLEKYDIIETESTSEKNTIKYRVTLRATLAAEPA